MREFRRTGAEEGRDNETYEDMCERIHSTSTCMRRNETLRAYRRASRNDEDFDGE